MKTDYILRRRALLGISALFCTTLLLVSACSEAPIVASDDFAANSTVAPYGDVLAAKKPPKAKFDVTVEGDISATTKAGTGGSSQILVNNFELDLTFFLSKLTCGTTTPAITGTQTGTIGLNKGAEGASGHAYILFQFRHNGIFHSLDLDGIIDDPSNWTPTSGMSNFITELPAESGHWTVIAKGKNNKNGCTGEGNGLVFKATVDAQ